MYVRRYGRIGKTCNAQAIVMGGGGGGGHNNILFEDCWYTLVVLLFVLEILKRKAPTHLVIFQSFFFPPRP